MLEKLSIEWKLPLAICSLLMAVVVTLSVLAYHEVAGSTQRVAAGRVENFASQLAGNFHASVDKGLVRLGARASQEPLDDYLLAADRTGPVAEEARAALERLLLAVEAPVDFAAVQLRDLDRGLLLTVGPDRDRIAELSVDELIPSPPPDIGGVGTMVDLGDRVVVPAFVPIVKGEEPLGYLVRWSYVALSTESREQVIGFLAPEASAFLGTPGGLWIDWERIVPEPPVGLDHFASSSLVERADGAWLAAAASIPQTPWIVVVEYPEELVMAPARRLLEFIGMSAVFLLLAGFGGVWLVARRITGPLRELTVASEALVGNSRADPDTAVGEDELGRLRRSFQRMSERVQEAHGGLEAKVGELRATQEREQAARAEAEEASARKDEFLAMLAHELRNPLSPITCAIAVVRSSRASASQREEALTAIERQARNMTRIVDDLLDVSRITRGKVALKRRTSDVGTLVESAIETSRPLIDAKRQRVLCTLPEAPLTAEVDATRMEQILANLVTNAAKYTEPDGHIWVSVAREANEVVFRVRDDGIGIPADSLARIFDLFHQVDQTIDRSRGGLGIGLTLVRKLVELHGGTVTASSPGLGQGSEFVVHIPVDAGGVEDVESAPPGRAPDVAAEPLRILVVEDGRDTRDLLELVLAVAGHEVVTAEDGAEGLARFRSFDPEVVVLDIGLPGMNGFEVARRIRAERPDVLIIAATGYGDPQTRARAREVGFDEHLVKPIAHEELASILARVRRRRTHVAASGEG